MSMITQKEYFAKMYPYEKLVDWLTCNGDDLSTVEFALEGKSTDGSKIYKRYVSVRTASELRSRVSSFTGIQAFHFGAYYNGVPTKGDTTRVPVRRVFTMDIDLTDKSYLNLNDASGNVSPELCDAAYSVSAMSAYILRRLLEKAFGYTKILIVYSGRRGVHVHVFDENAMQLSDSGRSAVVSFLNGNMHESGLSSAPGVRQMMVMYDLMREVYRSFNKFIIGKMNILDNCSARVQFINQLNLSRYEVLDHPLITPTMESLAQEVLDFETGEGAWQHIYKKVNGLGIDWVRERLDCVVLWYVWPVLDENVSRSLGHLIKVPFSCHAASGRVAVSMKTDRMSIYNFDPALRAPSLKCWDQLLMDEAVNLFHSTFMQHVHTATALFGDVDMEEIVPAPIHAARSRAHTLQLVSI